MSHDVVTTGIVLQAHSPLGTPTRPPHYAKDDDPVVMEDPVVLDIAKKHNVHPALVRSVCKIITLLHENSTIPFHNECNIITLVQHTHTAGCLQPIVCIALPYTIYSLIEM